MYVSLNYPEKAESGPEAAHVGPQLLEFRPLVFAMNEIDVQCGGKQYNIISLMPTKCTPFGQVYWSCRPNICNKKSGVLNKILYFYCKYTLNTVTVSMDLLLLFIFAP